MQSPASREAAAIDTGGRSIRLNVSIVYTQLRQSPIRRIRETLLGDLDGPSPAPQLTLKIIASLIGFIAFWRATILLFSIVFARLGIVEQWPPDIDVMTLWRYSVRWDSGWYLGINRFGYEFNPGEASSVAFFPLFPLMIGVFDRILPGSDVLAALVVVHAALVAAIVYVFQIVRIDFGDRIAWRTVGFLLMFPTAFFFSAVYAESLLLLGLAGAIYHARRGQWTRAALFGIVASASKIVGILIAIPLAIELIRQQGVSRRNPWPTIAVALSPLGGLAYFIHLQLAFGDFRVFFRTEDLWYREAFSPVVLMGFRRLLGDTNVLHFYPANTTPLRSVFLLADTTILILFLAAGIWLWWRVRPSYGALVLCMALVPAFSGSPQSMGRYMVVCFPAFILLGRVRSEAFRQAATLVFVFGLALTTYLFVNGYWAG